MNSGSSKSAPLPDYASTDAHRFNKAYPEASTDDLTWMKRFVRAMAIGIDGAEGNVAPCKETVRKYWNAFTAEHRRRHAPIPRDVADSITQVCVHVGPSSRR